jgi:hypothetical protein
MSSCGDITGCIEPSRDGVFRLSTTWPAALRGTSSQASGRPSCHRYGFDTVGHQVVK